LAFVAAGWSGFGLGDRTLVDPEDLALGLLIRVAARMTVCGVDVDAIMTSWKLIGTLLEVILSTAIRLTSPDQIVASRCHGLAVAARGPNEESQRALRVVKTESLNVEIARDVRLISSFRVGGCVFVDFDRPAVVVVLSQTGYK
jgi:hypothetical protein